MVFAHGSDVGLPWAFEIVQSPFDGQLPMNKAQAVDLVVELASDQVVPVVLMIDSVVAAVAVDVIVRLGLIADADLAAAGLSRVDVHDPEDRPFERTFGFATKTGQIRAILLRFHDFFCHLL